MQGILIGHLAVDRIIDKSVQQISIIFDILAYCLSSYHKWNDIISDPKYQNWSNLKVYDNDLIWLKFVLTYKLLD